MTAEKISVVIPVYNAEPYLKEAIDSVIAQDYQPLELIVIDDGSVDGSAKIARSYPEVHYVYQENAGIAGAMNSGCQLATGAYIASLDADDIWKPGKLSLQTKAFAADPDLDMVFGFVEQFLDEAVKSVREIRQDLGRMPGYVSSVMLIKRQSFFKVGLYNPNYTVGEFIDWYLRAQEIGLRETVLPDVLLRRRIHDTNTGLLQRDARGDYIKVLKSMVDRRRKG